MNAQERKTALNQGNLPPNMWSTKTKFRHGQCDPAGIVYTPEFFNVFNRVVEEWFDDALRIPYHDIIRNRRKGLGYVTASATFFTPCEMGDEAEIFVSVARIGSKSYQLELHVMKNGQEALRGELTTVTTDLDTHRPIEIPATSKTHC
ncbi:MAG: thioesterase family protein [Paracoccaceae bacterium]